MVMEKQKALAFTTPNLEGLLVLEQKKKKTVEEEEIEKMEVALFFGQGGEVVCMLCENEGVKMGLYRSGEGGIVRPLWVDLGGKVV